MKVTFIGTGEAFDILPNTSILVQAETTSILLDCGYSVPQSLWKITSDPNIPDGIFITHFHADHYFGITPLVMRMVEDGRSKKLTLFGQRNGLEKIKRLIELGYPGYFKKLSSLLEYVPVEDNKKLKFKEFEIRVARTLHTLPNYAVRLDFKDKSVGYTGDGKITIDVKTLLRGCNLIICECYSLEPTLENHACLDDILRFSSEIGVEKVAIVHVSRSYREILEEKLKEFEKLDIDVFVAQPLQSLEI